MSGISQVFASETNLNRAVLILVALIVIAAIGAFGSSEAMKPASAFIDKTGTITELNNEKPPQTVRVFHEHQEISAPPVVDAQLKKRMAAKGFFPSTNKFSDGLLRGLLSCGAQVAYIDERLNIKIKSNWDWAGEFGNGLAPVWKEGIGWRYINKNGDVAIELPEDCCAAENFSEGLAAVAVGGDKAPPFPSSGYMLYEHRSNARPGAKWEFIDVSGNVIIPASFEVGVKEVKQTYLGSSWCMYPPLTHPKFSEGLAAVMDPRTKKFGYINHDGTWIIKPRFAEAEPFHAGKAHVFR